MNDSKRKTVSPHKKPADLSETQWQRALRKQAVPEGNEAAFGITFLGGEHSVFGDYTVANPTSGAAYKVALRAAQAGSPNFCSCLDFKTNLLGTCKHIEAVLVCISKDKRLAKFLGDGYQPGYSSLYINYGEQREVKLRIGGDRQAEYQKLAGNYFDATRTLRPEAYDHIDEFLSEAAQISPDFRCYSDTMDFIIARRQAKTRRHLAETTLTNSYVDSLLKASLYPYQKDGVRFAVRAGRSLIADEMGLGKTVQAIAAGEFLHRECDAASILIVCPTSLKYQWKSEIEKFTDSSVQVIEGNWTRRRPQYASDALYKIISYNVAAADLGEIQNMSPDLVILDEAQRIKNWQTKTAQAAKKIPSTYAIVLTGTPIENKLEELYSIVQFIDPFRLGSLYNFLSGHQIIDSSGKVTGYKDLNRIHEILDDIVIRRTKQSVMSQLPERTDQTLFMPMTREQMTAHEDFGEQVSRLVSKWKRFGHLDEKDRQRLMSALNCMRMVCDSTYILDQTTRFDTKIAELMSLLDDALTTPGQKIVVFSQWERMTRLVRAELDEREVGYAYLHGGVPSHKRAPLLDDFRDDPACRVFLSTDAGGVGLNLQSASLLINLDIPWNPAVLEQRIGRVHRHGQKRPVNIINLVSKGSIEERMLDVLSFKSSLFAGVLDNGANEIFMGESKFKRFMGSVEQMTTASESAAPTAEMEADKPGADEPAADFLNAAAGFFDSLGKTLADPTATEQLVSSLVQKDQTTGQTYLKIPVQNEEIIAQGLEALTGLIKSIKS